MINTIHPNEKEVLLPHQRLLKRLIDIGISAILLVGLSPLLLLIIIAIRIDSKGSILFKQKRIGEGGIPFEIYKFRSMVVNAPKAQVAVNTRDTAGNLIHKQQNDPRVTRVGRIIRKTSLDELPQFLNILKGDMSVVGPRPEMPWMVEDHYQPWQHGRFAVPQGLTGWWQINGRSDKPMHLHTHEDLEYIRNYSVWLDIYIILKTPWVIVRGKGAY